ncbi:hypothetical protein TRIP_C80025 [Candidatus Zixiibacteriota bacterium]|nr:hypothetical protein TRIP_C80025 [candidate division Zixibacteria bacterium]
MNCRKARRLLNDQNHDGELELIRHLKTCPSCALEARASRILESALHYERNQQPSNATSISSLRSKVENSIKQISLRENTIMSRITSGISHRPRLAAGFGLAIVVLLFAVLVPLPYTRTVGYTVSFTNASSISNQVPSHLTAILGVIGYDNIKLASAGDNFEISGLPTRQAAREAEIAFRKLTGIQSESIISPVTRRVSGSLYAQVVESQRKIEVDATGKSDAEIESEIIQKLNDAGYQANVSVTTDASGERKIDVNLSRQAGDTVQQEKLIISTTDSNSSNIAVPLPIQVKVETEGKTDAQIIQEVKDRLAGQGISNPEVTVTTEPDGKKKIEVKVEKEEKR